MTFQCADFEDRLTDFLDGTLARADEETATAHLEMCGNCRTLVEDVRATLALCQQAEELEPPVDLAERILEQTVGKPRRLTWLEQARAWMRPVMEPRFALSFAMALFSVSLVINALGIPLRDVRLSDLNPANIVRRIDSSAHLTYARGVKFVNDLRVVYEIQSRLRISQPPAEEEQRQEEPKKPAEPKKDSPRNSADEDHGRRYLARYEETRSLQL